MAVIAGIDEAGFGPVLGPLVVCTAALEAPEAALEADLWQLLAPTVRRSPSRRAGTLAIGDSKKLYHRNRPRALEHLERGVLAMLATRGVRVESLRGLLKVLAPGVVDRLAEYPWYADADLPLPHAISATDAALAGNALAAALARAGMRLAAMRAEVVLVGDFNRMVRATQNKSVTLFDVSSRLLAYLWRRLWRDGSPGAVRVYADRQGGRVRYRAPLQRIFPDCDFRILDETEQFSGYRITVRRRAFELLFGVEFDQQHLPAALASMVSKYIRELCMELFNRFWARHVPRLAPTAGYYTDGMRFLEDIAAAARTLGVPEELLRRSR